MRDDSIKLLARRVHEKFVSERQTLAIAESCTGGYLVEQLTQFSGASRYLLVGVVSYSNAAKTEFLHVSSDVLSQFGSVSQEVVLEMAKGLLCKTSADVVISVSGILGPTGGSTEKPVGTIWAAIGGQNKPLTAKLVPLQKVSSRSHNRREAVRFLLQDLYDYK